MRLLGMVVAGALIAGPSAAATWVFSGTEADRHAVIGGDQFVPGQTYYVQLIDQLPLESGDMDFYYRSTVYWYDAPFPVGEDYYLTGLYGATTDYGFEGAFVVPVDHWYQNNERYVSYDRENFRFEPLARSIPDNWTLTISDSPIDAPLGVPEPMTWMLMVMGFGIVGAGLRRQVPVAVG